MTPIRVSRATVTADRLRVRSGPGTTYTIVGYTTRGTSVDVLERRSGWSRVNYAGNRDGWVTDDYIRDESSDTTGQVGSYPTPVLISPRDGRLVHDPLTFEWRWDGVLADGDGFDVQVWKDGEAPAGIAHPSFVTRAAGNRYMLRMPTLSRAKGNKYTWTVTVVRVETGRSLSPRATPDTFRYE